MDEQALNYIKNSLSNHHTALLDWINEDSEKKQTQLGGAKVKEVLNIVDEIQNALKQIDQNQYGKCKKCHEDIETECLELDFTSDICLDHYSPDQLRALEKDLELTARVQKHLYPCCIPSLPDIEIAVHTESARIASGDYYDFFGYANGNQGIAIADVMGKGLPASILMSNLQATLRILGPEYENLNELAGRLNKIFSHNLKLIRFITISLVTINAVSRTLQYCNAGHNPAIWWKASSGTTQLLNPTGPAIGLTMDAIYKTVEIQLAKGDMFLLYTDGLIEARNLNKIEFGEDQLISYMKESHNEPVESFIRKLLNKVKKHAGKFGDDVTLIAIKIK